MKKLFWTTLAIGLICHASIAQQANKAAMNEQLAKAISDSVLFRHFTCTLNNFNKVLLQWGTGSSSGVDYFVLEHGIDSSHFETLGILKRTASSNQFEFMDGNPSAGLNYYRIKSTDSSGLVLYSDIFQINIEGNPGFKFYPNPVDKFLIIDSQQPGDLQIISNTGNLLLTRQLQAGVQVVNVSSLEKGEYILRMLYKEGNRLVLDHLLKN